MWLGLFSQISAIRHVIQYRALGNAHPCVYFRPFIPLTKADKNDHHPRFYCNSWQILKDLNDHHNLMLAVYYIVLIIYINSVPYRIKDNYYLAIILIPETKKNILNAHIYSSFYSMMIHIFFQRFLKIKYNFHKRKFHIQVI